MKHFILIISLILFSGCTSKRYSISRQETHWKDSLRAIHLQQKEKENILNNLVTSSLTLHHFRLSTPDSTGQQFIEEYTELTGQKERISLQETKEIEMRKDSITQFISFNKEVNKKATYSNLPKVCLILLIGYALIKVFIRIIKKR